MESRLHFEVGIRECLARRTFSGTAREIYRHRKTQGERPFAEIKQTMRFRRFALRGRANIRGEWDLVCAAFNLQHLQSAQTA